MVGQEALVRRPRLPQDVQESEGERRIRARDELQVNVGAPGGAMAAGVDDDDLRAAPARSLDENPVLMRRTMGRISAPDEERARV